MTSDPGWMLAGPHACCPPHSLIHSLVHSEPFQLLHQLIHKEAELQRKEVEAELREEQEEVQGWERAAG